MADIIVDPTAVQPTAGARVESGLLGETVSAGQAIYGDEAGLLWLADAKDVAKADVLGITLAGGAAGQAITYIQRPSLVFSAILSQGAAYFLSETPGGINNVIPVLSGSFTVLLGCASSPTQLELAISNLGCQIP